MATLINNISSIREEISGLRKKHLTIGLVPTMGALHIGHEALIKRAKQECDIVIASIFVNPIQFGPKEDFDKYPRPLEADKKVCDKLGVDLIFAPEIKEMYPDSGKNITAVAPPESYRNKLCGKSRKGHFDGVATVVLKLFNIITPDRAYFGEKDAQQLIIIKKMVKDLNLSVDIISCPIIREPDGLACSSRNKYLSKESRGKALCIFRALKKAEELFNAGNESVSAVISTALKLFDPEVEIEYFEAYDLDTFEVIEKIKKNTLIAVAVKIDGVRLIDNLIV